MFRHESGINPLTLYKKSKKQSVMTQNNFRFIYFFGLIFLSSSFCPSYVKTFNLNQKSEIFLVKLSSSTVFFLRWIISGTACAIMFTIIMCCVCESCLWYYQAVPLLYLLPIKARFGLIQLKFGAVSRCCLRLWFICL